MVFVEGPIQQFQCQQNSDVLYELLKKILWQQILSLDHNKEYRN